MSSLTHTVPQVRSDADISKPTEGEIAALAYQLWEARGCPIGSPDEDWLLAEAEPGNHQKVFIATA